MVFGGGAEDLKGRKANLENDKYLNDEFGGDEFDEKNPNNILKINGMEEENGACLRAIGEFLNQVRNYRCLWP